MFDSVVKHGTNSLQETGGVTSIFPKDLPSFLMMVMKSFVCLFVNPKHHKSDQIKEDMVTLKARE